ncbi:hypothetical protein GCM10022198_06170 [Klugiella xanthotipulae]|uniref:hypothetical protein n=1 Tax=Klugiella xanthotipulae TaxID=244735 RepID=UPI0014771E19|nr:hypothetical protein [Klugiella xanthotipulae]
MLGISAEIAAEINADDRDIRVDERLPTITGTARFVSGQPQLTDIAGRTLQLPGQR